MKILLVSPLPPYPPRSGDALRLWNLIRCLGPRHEITLCCFYGEQISEESRRIILGHCAELHALRQNRGSRLTKALRLILQLARGIPFKIKTGWSPHSRQVIGALSRTGGFDLAIFFAIETSANMPFLAPEFRGRTVLDIHNVSFFQHLRIYRQSTSLAFKIRQFLNWYPFISYEPRAAASADLTVVVSELDRQLLRAFEPLENIRVMPNGIEVDAIPLAYPPAESKDILYLGSLSYFPNSQAAIELAREIMPLVRSRLPDARLAIVGRSPPPAVLELAGEPGVSVHGDVPDVAPYFNAARVMAVPLRAGGGTRLKILEAMAYGIPVVTTSVGCEGIDAKDGRELLIADDEQAFAAAIHRLLTCPQDWLAIRDNARRLVAERYNWSRIISRYEDMLTQLANSPREERP